MAVRSLTWTLYLSLTYLVSPITCQVCEDPAFVEMSLEERLYQAEIILYGQDQLSGPQCPPETDNCRTTPRNQREYSNFMVYCVVKNNGPPVPSNITIHPRSYGDRCARTRFSQGVEGWVYLVTVTYEEGKYYWDEINGLEAFTTIYIVDNDDKLRKAGNICNLPPAVVPEGESEVKNCPSTLNRTRDDGSCFKGCERGWKPVGKECYQFSDPAQPKTRNEAAIACLMKDSNLLAIESQEEEGSLSDVFTNHVDTEWWTSGFHNGQKWVWQDGVNDPEIGFNTWRSKEPSGPRGVEDYVAILYQKSRWGWSDTSADRLLPYVCEKPRGEHRKPDLTECSSNAANTAPCHRALVKALLNDTFLQPPSLPKPDQCDGKSAYDDINCLRAERGSQSLVDLLFSRSAYNPFINRRELDVVFASVPGEVTVCGRKYTWPRSRLIQPRLAESEVYDSWFFQADATFRAVWEAEPDTLYTLLILDLDLWSVHGAWMNIAGGNVTSGYVVQEYIPLAVATPDVTATFAFLLFEQNSPALLTDKIAAMLTHSYTRVNDFNLTSISDELGLGDLVGVNVVRVSSDAYSSKFFQDAGFTNHCPRYLQDAYSDLRSPPIPLDGPLSLVMDVQFQTEDEEWTMCCKQFSVEGHTNRLDLYGMTLTTLPTEDVRVAPFINITKGNVRLDGLNRQQTFKAVCVFGEKAPDTPIDCSLPQPVDITYEWYTLVMIDGGTVSQRSSSTMADYPLNWLITNIPDGIVPRGETIIQYKSPAPDPEDKSEHLYLIYMFKQKQKISNMELERFSQGDCSTLTRCLLDLQAFLNYNTLSLAGVNWFVSKPDIYTVRTLIKDDLMPPAQACLTLFPDTKTYGPLVVCDPPKRVEPTVRPVISDRSTSCSSCLSHYTFLLLLLPLTVLLLTPGLS